MNALEEVILIAFFESNARCVQTRAWLLVIETKESPEAVCFEGLLEMEASTLGKTYKVPKEAPPLARSFGTHFLS